MNPGRNDPCPCGSGKKYKKCCQNKFESGLPSSPRQQRPGAVAPSDAAKRSAPSPAELNQLVALFNAGRHAELESRARLLVERQPDSGIVWKILGASLQAQGKDSLPVLQKAAGLLPNDADTHYNLGNALMALGRLDEAEASYRRTLRIRPNDADAHFNLGNIFRSLGRLDETEASYRRALQLRPDYAEAHGNLGNILLEQGRVDEAEASYRRALQLKPDYAVAHYNLGSLLQDLGRLSEAEASYRCALQLRPDWVDGYINFGGVLMDMDRLDEAGASYRCALRIRPDCAEAHSNLGNVLLEQGRPDEAEASCRRALQIKPDLADAHCNLGNILNEQGRLDEAEACYRRALQIRPDFAVAHFRLASLRKAQAGDDSLGALIAAGEAARNSKKPLAKKDAACLHFALGKSYDDVGDHEKAFPHFLEGGRLKRATLAYDPNRVAQHFAGILRNFDKATVERLRGGGNPSHLPIFVLGMPRSGTTLTEQIIASHPEVHGAGELNDLAAILRHDIAGAVFPDNLHSLDRDRLTAWGTEYVNELQRRAPEARRITDKMPANFLAIGLIHLMLPNAKIIHVNRDPLDTCLSCFTTLFHRGNEYTYDLAELGRYYADYARLMEHWRRVLPAGAFLDVQYEDIVADQAAQTRRLIEYCGLEWNDACLDFHQNKRAVRTASMTQVRQPIYKSSVERWRRYEKFLGPLLDALGDLAPAPKKSIENDEHETGT